MIRPADLTLVVTASRKLSYLKLTAPLISQYCRRMGYGCLFYQHDHVPLHVHPAWNKFAASCASKTPHVVLWDADVVPLPHCPPIHKRMDIESLLMAKIKPHEEIRKQLASRYGAQAASMNWETAVIGVPEILREFLADVFESFGYFGQVDAEHGELNNRIIRQQIPVERLDSKFCVAIDKPIERADLGSSYALRFTSQSDKLRNIGRLLQILPHFEDQTANQVQ